MSKTSKVTIKCPKCGNAQECEIYSSMNVSADPELKKVFGLNKWNFLECKKCGRGAEIPTNMMYHDMDEQFVVWYAPNGISDEEMKGVADSGARFGEITEYFGKPLVVNDRAEAAILVEMCERKGLPKLEAKRAAYYEAARELKSALATANAATDRLFLGVFGKMLDYGDQDILYKSAQWGKTAFRNIEHLGGITASDVADHKEQFIFAVALAFIVGHFGDRAFGDHNFYNDDSAGEIEFDLGAIGLNSMDVEYCLDDDITKERREELRRMNCLTLNDIWSEMWGRIREIYKGLVSFYKPGPKDPDWAIYSSLLEIFEEGVDEDGCIIRPGFTDGGEMTAYSYVSGGFEY
jgi:predicted nucleic-acid-binding Zn-ribbon protein